MFTSLIESIRDAVDETKLTPFHLSAEKIRAANKTLEKVRRDGGYDPKPDVKTKRKVIMRLDPHVRTGTDDQ